MGETKGGLILPPGYATNASGLPMTDIVRDMRRQLTSLMHNPLIEVGLLLLVPNLNAVDYAFTFPNAKDQWRLCQAIAKDIQGKQPGGSRVWKFDDPVQHG